AAGEACNVSSRFSSSEVKAKAGSLDFPAMLPTVACQAVSVNVLMKRCTSTVHRASFVALTVSLALAAVAARAEDDLSPLLHRHWFEARTAHFNVYSCGDTQQVSKLTARLEQFRQAYSLLAGAQAVASVPIVVLAFPDPGSMHPFRPLRDGKPANLTAFFHHGSDENLIVLPLIESISLQAIFHEYAHLLLRHNDPFWPLRLKEGMAEI